MVGLSLLVGNTPVQVRANFMGRRPLQTGKLDPLESDSVWPVFHESVHLLPKNGSCESNALLCFSLVAVPTGVGERDGSAERRRAVGLTMDFQGEREIE